MKTITLTDEAYERLLQWKSAPKDSFSNVVLRVVPKRGALADLARQIDQLPPLTDQQAQTLRETVDQSNVLTRNVGEFRRVPGLEVVDYAAT